MNQSKSKPFWHRQHSQSGLPKPRSEAPARPKNNVEQLLSYCRGMHNDISAGKLKGKEYMLGPIMHLKKNLVKVTGRDLATRNRSICLQAKFIERLLTNPNGEPLSQRQQHIQQILTEAQCNA